MAAKAVYQVISPNAKEENRKESIQSLSDMSAVEGADPKRIAETLQEMF